jgi:hypothetical protein
LEDASEKWSPNSNGFKPTVASRAAAGSKVGVGNEAKNKDQEILVQHLLLKEDDTELLTEIQRQVTQGCFAVNPLNSPQFRNSFSRGSSFSVGWTHCIVVVLAQLN